MYGGLDSVQGMINRILDEMNNENIKVILTGGFSTVISPGISFPHHIETLLTLIGMEIINKKN